MSTSPPRSNTNGHASPSSAPSQPTTTTTFNPTTAPPNTSSPLQCHLHTSTSNTYHTLPMLQTIATPCAFSAEIFDRVMLNLIRNPNITSSHLFRADVFWDSDKDASFEAGAWRLPDCDDSEGYGVKGYMERDGQEVVEVSKFVKHMKKELRPVGVVVEGFELRRSVVRQMVPRNTKLDGPLVQTCHFLRRKRKVRRIMRSMHGTVVDVGRGTVEDVLEGHGAEGCDQEEEEEDNLVVYVPHVENEDEMPWYHPKVKALCFLHTSTTTSGSSPRNSLSIHISPFPARLQSDSPTPTLATTTSTTPTCYNPKLTPPISTPSASNRLTRTLQNLLRTIHRHGTGQASGYQKRVHHDRLIPQARVQDTYTRLKNKYARDLLDKYWKEDLDPTKGVFEDLGIAAFVVELWGKMYEIDGGGGGEQGEGAGKEKEKKKKPKFPGFVDIGCGNAILDFVLMSEGYQGWGFDARARKTWDAFPEEIGQRLKEMVVVPSIFGQNPPASTSPTTSTSTLPTTSTSTTTTPPPPPSPSPTPSATPEKPLIHTPQNTTASSTIANLHNPHLQTKHGAIPTHSGLFPSGTFIISNHADELTIWTPLIAFLNESPFVSIPCCSHDLSGRRCRFPPPVVGKERQEKDKAKGKRQGDEREQDQDQEKAADLVVDTQLESQEHLGVEKVAGESRDGTQPEPQLETRPQPQPNKPSTKPPKPPAQPSAYSTLCSAVARLATQVGYDPEEEYLRIPSTRNVAIIGRSWKRPMATAAEKVEESEVVGVEDRPVTTERQAEGEQNKNEGSKDSRPESFETKTELVKQIVRQELGVVGLSLEDVAKDWRDRAASIAGSKMTATRVAGEL